MLDEHSNLIENKNPDDRTNIQVSSKKINNKKNKKNSRKKFKMPSAISIIIGVLIFSLFVTWITYLSTGGSSSWYDIQNGKFIPGTYDELNNFILDPNNFSTVTTFLINNPDFSEFFKVDTNADGDSIYILNGITSEAEFIGSALHTQIEFYNSNLLIADEWYNFGDSNWFVSNNGMYGILDLFYLTVAGGFSAFTVVFYVFAIAGIVEVLLYTGTLESGVGSLVKGLKNKELILIPVLFTLFSLGGTLFGMQEETLGLIPIIIPVLIFAGFDAATGYFVTVLGTTTGIASSVLDPFSIGVMADGIGVNISTGIMVRLVLFFIYTGVGAWIVTLYGIRVRKNPNKSVETLEQIEQNKVWAHEVIGDVEHAKTLDRKQKIALIVFGITFIWMVFALLPWGVWIDSIGDSRFWLVFSSIFYNKVLIGEWYFLELSILFVIVAYFLSRMFGISHKQMKENWIKSSRNVMGVAIILIISRTVSIVLDYSGSAETIVNSVFSSEFDGSKPVLFSVTLLPLFLIMAVFIPSTSGLAGITAPIIAPVIDKINPSQQFVAEVGVLAFYPLAQGVINMFSPTTGLVITQAEASRIDYWEVLPYTFAYGMIMLVIGVVSIVPMLILI